VSSQVYERTDSTTGPNGAKATVLIAEDEVILRMYLADALRIEGYAVIEAGNADEALAVVYSGTRIDLLITDIQMPGELDGRQLAARVRSAYPSTKIAIASAHVRGPADAASADAAFSKPYEFERLLDGVRKLLDS
jgi:two-component system, response regulator PdtaR